MKIEFTTSEKMIPLLLKAEAPEGIIVNAPPVDRNRSGDLMQWVPDIEPVITFSIEIAKGVGIAIVVDWIRNSKFKDKIKVKKDGQSIEITNNNLYDLYKDKEK